MSFRLAFTTEADENLRELDADRSRVGLHGQVLKCLGLLEVNPRHPSLQTRKYHALKSPDGDPVFHSYVQNHTANAYRVFWWYGPGRGVITISSIVPHP